MWTFELSGRPFSQAERDLLAEDLLALGSDTSLLDVLSATVEVRSRWTQPQVLRGFGPDGGLRGAAVVFLCRDAGASFGFEGRLRSLVRRSPPIWFWERTGLGTDGHTCPGLVTAGVSRKELRHEALRWLRRHVALGTVIESRDEPRPPSSHVGVGPGVCRLDLAMGGASALVERHRNLPRKQRRYRAHGGSLRVQQGALPAALTEELLSAYAVPRPVNPPFVELYPRMVRAHSAMDAPQLWHVVADIDGAPVGYHSWWHSGTSFSLLSGAFTRPTGGTSHAYENVLLASVDLAHDLGCRTLHLGPTVNAAKRSLFDSSPTDLRFVSALPPVRWGVAAVLPRSALSPAALDRATQG
jgi:hypothetical protein